MSGLRFGLSLSMQGRGGGRFGAHSPAGYLLGNEPAGMAIDFASMDMLIRGGGLNWKGNPNDKLTYTSPSTKWITNRHGVLSGGTALRCDHDPATLDTSATSENSLGVGSGALVRKTLTTTGAVTYVAGQDIVASDASDITKWIAGRVVSYSGGSLVVDFRAASGYFTCSSWKIIVARGLLVEEQRTNMLLRSSTLDTTWVAAAGYSSITSNTVTSPDGTTTADTLDDAGANNGVHRIYQTVTVVSGATYTVSAFVKNNNRRYVSLAMNTVSGGSEWFSAKFDLQSGIVTAGQAGATGTYISSAIVAQGDGWYRISVTGSLPTTSAYVLLSLASNGTTFTPGERGSQVYIGDGSSVYVWGAQLEVGAFPTSYIPTTSAQVTRAADNISLANSLYPFIFDEGTLVVEAAIEGENVNDNRLAVIGNATASYMSIDLSRSSNDSILLSTVINNAQTGVGETGNKNTLGQILRTAGAYKENDFAVCLDGGALSVDLTGSVPTTTVDNLVIGRFPANIRYLNGHIKSLVYLPRRASNSELQAISA